MVKLKNVLLTVLCASLVLMMSGCSLLQGFDASAYVEAVLDLNLKGDVTKASEMMKNTEEEELEKIYEARIQQFADHLLISGMQMEEPLKTDYSKLCMSIFHALEYEVMEAEKISTKEYKVKVTFQPVDVFPVFEAAVKADSEKLLAKAQNGEYQGTEEEITAQMQKEFVERAYELLKNAFENRKTEEEKSYTFHLKREEDQDFEVKEEELSEFIIQILQLDQIQD